MNSLIDKLKRKELAALLDGASDSDGSGQDLISDLRRFIVDSNLTQQVNNTGVIHGWMSYTILTFCANRGHVSLMRLLIQEFHADSNGIDRNNKTPLIYAANRNRFDAVRYLLSLPNTDVEIRVPPDYKSALDFARTKGHDRIIALLAGMERPRSGSLDNVPPLPSRIVPELVEQLTHLQMSHIKMMRHNQALQDQLKKTTAELNQKNGLIADLEREKQDVEVEVQKLYTKLAAKNRQLDVLKEQARKEGFEVACEEKSAEPILSAFQYSNNSDESEEKSSELATENVKRERKISRRLFSDWFRSNFPINSDVWSQYYESFVRYGLDDMSFWLGVKEYDGDEPMWDVCQILTDVLSISTPMHIKNIIKHITTHSGELQDWFVHTVHLGEYADTFVEAGFDMNDLASEEVTDETLKEMGIESVGHRLRILFHTELIKMETRRPKTKLSISTQLVPPNGKSRSRAVTRPEGHAARSHSNPTLPEEQASPPSPDLLF